MKQKLLLGMAILVSTAVTALAGPTFCVTNSYGEQTTLSVTGKAGHVYSLTGSINYAIYGGTVWPCAGTYNATTHQLSYVATNPSPDGCTMWASTVTFTYSVTGHGPASGTFANDCGNTGSLSASGIRGSCGFAPVKLKDGEYGGSATHKSLRSQMELPQGINLQELFRSAEIMVSPNPAVNFAGINISVQESVKLTIAVYNQQGNLVNALVNTKINGGDHKYTWNLRDAAGNKVNAGYYTIKITMGADVETRSILVTQ